MKKDVSTEIVESMLIEAGLIEGKVGRIALGYLKGAASTLGSSIPIPGLGLILGITGATLFGHTVQQRVNSMYYECKSIQDPKEKRSCRLKLLDLVIGIQKNKLKDKNLTPKQREKLQKSIGEYNMAKMSIMGTGKGQGTFEENATLDEAATGGWWKALLSAPIVGAVAQSRLERSFYHCKELPSHEQAACKKQVLKTVLSILQSRASKEQYNMKLQKKIVEVKERLAELGQY